jgi:hypothetical protein
MKKKTGHVRPKHKCDLYLFIYASWPTTSMFFMFFKNTMLHLKYKIDFNDTKYKYDMFFNDLI